MGHISYGNTFAPIIVSGALSVTFVVSTGSIWVWGITVSSNAVTDNIIFEDNDGNIILDFQIIAFTGFSMPIPFLADNGLSIRLGTPSINVGVSVAHSQDGA